MRLEVASQHAVKKAQLNAMKNQCMLMVIFPGYQAELGNP
jgi:predicted dinucleotide-utilizing enzyme